jgi:protein-L-isoaspartate(D-aspartate) O-methyltransferase
MKKQYIVILIFGIPLLAFWGCRLKGENNMKQSKSIDFARKRQEMVKNQIEARGVRDSLVLEAMRTVERHRFVPQRLQHLAYIDEPLPIGYQQTISQPFIVAYMTEMLDLKGNERVLEIGTGSGYQAAILGEIVKEVYTIEIIEALAERAQSILEKLKYDHVTCRAGDGYKGWSEKAPFDAIIVTAAPSKVPNPLIEQLKEGGRMIIPVGTYFQELILFKKEDGILTEHKLIPVRFVPMTGKIQN